MKPRKSPVMHQIMIMIVSLLFMTFCSNEIDRKMPIESDKKKRVRTLFAVVKHKLVQWAYFHTGNLAVIIYAVVHPKNIWSTILKPEHGKNISVLRRRRGIKNWELKAIRGTDDKETLFHLLGFWGKEIGHFIWYGNWNVLHSHIRLHYANDFKKARSCFTIRMQKFFIETLGTTYGMTIMKAFHSTTYYFSTSGDNLDDGLTELTAKSGLFNSSGGLNGIALNPGDNVLFKCGDDFNPGTGSVFIYNQRAGTSVNPITWTSYGTGTKPILPSFLFGSGSQLCWHLIGLNGEPYNYASSNSDWFSEDYGRSDYCLFEDCEISRGGGIGLDVGIWTQGGKHVEINNVTIECNNVGILFEASPGNPSEDVYIHDCLIYSETWPTLGAQDGISIHTDGGVYDMGPNWWVVDNIVYGFSENCIDFNSGDHLYMFHNEMYDAGEGVLLTGYFGEYVYVFQNFMQTGTGGWHSPLYMGNMHSWIYNNIFENLGTSGRSIVTMVTDYIIHQNTGDFHFSYNTCLTIAGMDRAVLYFVGDNNGWDTAAGSFTYYNNVFCTKNASGSTCVGRAGTYPFPIGTSAVLFDYNCWYQGSTTFSAIGQNWTYWQGTWGYDTHGMNVDPLLVDVTQTDRDYTDYQLMPLSPCRNNALTISTGTYYYYDVGMAKYINSETGIGHDYISSSRASDIGALEYGGPPPVTYYINGEILVGGLPLVGVFVSDGTRSAYTGALGTYSIPNVPDGIYTVTPTLIHYTFAPVSRSVTVSGADQNNIDFTATEDPKYSIKGTILEGVAPLGGVNVSNGAGGSDLTDMVTGEFDIPDNYNGPYTVTPNMVGYTFAPPNRSVTVAGADNVGNDFAATAIPSSTGDLQIRNIVIQNIQMGNI